MSVATGGAQGNYESGYTSISANGRFVAFDSAATNLAASDTNGTYDVFVRDRQLGTTERVSVATGGAQGNNESRRVSSISADGRFVEFESYASNLVAGDTGGFRDIFVHDRSGSPPPSAFCFGDGTAAACPCANVGLAGNGCASSVNPAGANLSGMGLSSVAFDTFVLQGTGMPNGTALYFQGTAQLSGGLGLAFGDGLHCAGGTIIHLGTKQNSAGASQYPSLADTLISIRGLIPITGGTRTYHVWYRNAAAFCTAATFNLSNGLEVQWIP